MKVEGPFTFYRIIVPISNLNFKTGGKTLQYEFIVAQSRLSQKYVLSASNYINLNEPNFKILDFE